MISNTLKKWKQKWRFLLGVTLAQAAATFGALIVHFCIDLRPLPPPFLLLLVLCWPVVDALNPFSPDKISGVGIALFFLVLFWNAFLWAWALLEIKQVLARALACRRRAPE